jgi:hypothetical protein
MGWNESARGNIQHPTHNIQWLSGGGVMWDTGVDWGGFEWRSSRFRTFGVA